MTSIVIISISYPWTSIDWLSLISKTEHARKKMRFLPSYRWIVTIAWLHQLDSYTLPSEKAKSELHKNYACCYERILEADHHKTVELRHNSPISNSIKVRRRRHAGYRWRRKNELISDVLLWTPTYGHTCMCRLAKTLWDARCSQEWIDEEDADDFVRSFWSSPYSKRIIKSTRIMK